MHTPILEPLTTQTTPIPGHTVPEQVPPPCSHQDSDERYDDPAQAEELERQQDA
jgi:hypothetical protein